MDTVFWNYIGVTKGLEIERRKKLTTAKHTIPYPWTTTAMKYTNMLNTRAKLLLLLLIKICKCFSACIKLLNHGRRNMDEHRLVCLGYQQCRFRLFHDIGESRGSGECLSFSLLSSKENATPIPLLSPFAIR